MALTEVDFPIDLLGGRGDYNAFPAGVALQNIVSIGFSQYMLISSPFDQGGTDTLLLWRNGASSGALDSRSSGTIFVGDLIRLSANRFVATTVGFISSYDSTWLYVFDDTGTRVNNGGFGYHLQVSPADAPGPIIATNSTTIYASFVDGSGNWKIAKSTDTGDSFTIGGTVVNGGRIVSGGLAAISGNLYVMWHDLVNSLLKVYESTDDGATWSLFSTSGAANVGAVSGMFHDATCWAFAYHTNSGTSQIRFNKTMDGGATWTDYLVSAVGGSPMAAVYTVHRSHFQVQYTDDTNVAGGHVGSRDAAHLFETLDGGTTWAAPPTVVNQPVGATYGAYYQAKMTNGLAANSGLDGGQTNAYTAALYSDSSGWFADSNQWVNAGANPDADPTAGFGPALTLNNTIQPSAGFGPSVTLTATVQPSAGFGPALTLAVPFPLVFSVAHTLGWTDSIVINSTRSFAVVDNITFTQRLDLEYSVFDNLVLAQSIGLNLVLSKDVIDNIALSDLVGLNFERDEDDADNLSLTDAIGLNLQLSKSDTDTLALTQQVDYDLIRPVVDDLALTQDVGLNLVLSFDVVDDLELSDDAVAWSDGPVGVIDNDCLDPAFPHLQIRDSFTFSWPAASPSLIVDVKIPEFGNTQEFEWGKVVRRTLGGQLSIANDASWPTVDVLKWSFRFLSQAKRDDLEAFFTASAGDLIAVTDHENTDWSGVILDDEVTFKPEGVGCQWAFDVNFRVVSRSIE